MGRVMAALELLEGINFYSVTFRIILASVIGGCIGVNRSRHRRAAGTRTHLLVCLGACITTLLGFYTAYCLGFSNDPLRMGAQVVSGIGFLGAGTIMIRNHSQVTGLTTAAGLWTTACIGLAVGAGFYWVALLSFVVVLISFTVLFRLERAAGSRNVDAYYIELRDVSLVKEFYEQVGSQIAEADIIPAKSGLPDHVGMELVVRDPKMRQSVLDICQRSENVMIAIPHHQ